jgi:hypothetical protein
MHDANLEERLRSVLRQEGDSIPFTITTEELERRLALRRRARNGQRLSLVAAGVATVAVGAIFALGSGWLTNGPVGGIDATPSPAPTPTATAGPTPLPSIDPLAALPVLVQDPLTVDVITTQEPGDPTSPDPVLRAYGMDGVHMAAREAGVKVVCLGSDAQLSWGWDLDRTAVASETITCDGTIQSYRYDVEALQPMIGQILVLEATPRTAFRILVETFGEINDPVPTALPSLATPVGTVVANVTMNRGASASAAPVALRAGTVPPRGVYLVALVCLGEGRANWSIGAEGTRDFVAGEGIPCNGAPVGFEVAEGIPPTDAKVWVTTDPANTWHLIVTDPYGAPKFIAPPLFMWPGTTTSGPGGAGLGQCVSHGDGGDSCAGPYHARDGAAVMTVAADSDVTVALQDGWTIGQARVRAATGPDVRNDPFVANEMDVAYFETGGDSLTFPLMRLEPGDWVVRVILNGTKGTDTFGGIYDIPVNIAP